MAKQNKDSIIVIRIDKDSKYKFFKLTNGKASSLIRDFVKDYIELMTRED